LSWVQAHALVALSFEPAAARHRAAWVRHAERVSVRRLTDDLERAVATGVFAPPTSWTHACNSRDPAALQIGAIVRSRAEHEYPGRVRIFFAAPPEVAHLFRAALATVQRRLERLHQRAASQSESLAAMLAHALATWVAHDPTNHTARDHRVFERDG